jgi:hypothetical protein
MREVYNTLQLVSGLFRNLKWEMRMTVVEPECNLLKKKIIKEPKKKTNVDCLRDQMSQIG